jgi:hypothetical protein
MNPTVTPARSQAGTSSVPASRPTSPPTISRSTGPGHAASSGTGTGKTDEHRRARREQLRNFYGIAEPERASVGGTAPQGVGDGQDVLDIDAGGFDAAAYYEDMIQKSSLADLMQRAVALTAGASNDQPLSLQTVKCANARRGRGSAVVPAFLGIQPL